MGFLAVENDNSCAPRLQIYRDFVRSVIKATRKLNIIFQGASGSMGSEGFPSWVPDRSKRNEDGASGMFNNDRFCAARNTEHPRRIGR